MTEMPKIITKKKESKKDHVIEELFKICKRKNNFVFHNDLVKDVCKKIGFGVVLFSCGCHSERSVAK
jgi:hypothetical protein